MTPLDLEAIVGSTCTVYGVNDMARFGAYMSEAYGLRTSEIYYDLDRALTEVIFERRVRGRSGRVVGAGIRQPHRLHLEDRRGQRVHPRPASGANSQHRFTAEELRGTEWLYFTTSKGEGR
ncbi:MAG: hypothetical protein ACLUW6_02395 [Coriobacteriaceae bacterium]